MHLDDFYYLLGGMMDIEAPELTDPIEDLIQKRVQKKMAGRGGRIPQRPRRR
jgi:hypothetical protein